MYMYIEICLTLLNHQLCPQTCSLSIDLFKMIYIYIKCFNRLLLLVNNDKYNIQFY